MIPLPAQSEWNRPAIDTHRLQEIGATRRADVRRGEIPAAQRGRAGRGMAQAVATDRHTRRKDRAQLPRDGPPGDDREMSARPEAAWPSPEPSRSMIAFRRNLAGDQAGGGVRDRGRQIFQECRGRRAVEGGVVEGQAQDHTAGGADAAVKKRVRLAADRAKT